MSAEDVEEVLLKPHWSPFTALHGETRELADLHQRGMAWERARIFGQRGIYRPTMAIHTISRLGPVRHALAQRAIAGTLEVHAPFAAPLSEEAEELVAKIDAGRARDSQTGTTDQ